MNFSSKLIAGLALIAGSGLVVSTPAFATSTTTGSTGPATVHLLSMDHASSGKPSAARAHDVAVLQEALDGPGAKLRIDGVWGPATESALRNYQRDNGLQATGTLDRQTRAQLDPIG